MLPRDRSLVPYKSHLPAIRPEVRTRRLTVSESVMIGDPITIIVSIATAVATAATAVATAVGASAALAAGIGLVAGMATTLAIVIGIGFAVYSAITAPKLPSPSFGVSDDGGLAEGSPRYSFGPLQNTVSGNLALPVLYGELKLAGNAIWQDDYNVDTVKRLIVICEGEISSITNVRLNDIPIAQLSGCSVTTYVGTSSQDMDSRANGRVYGLRFVAHMALTITASEQLKGSPVVTSQVQGKLVQTWSGSRWSGPNVLSYSRNPAACLRDYLTSTRYGVGLPEHIIDDVAFGEVFDYCAVTIDNNEGGTQVRFQLDIILDSKRPHLDVLNDILVTFGGFLVFDGKKLKLRIEKSEAPVQPFTMDNILENSFRYEIMPKDMQPNRLKVLYIDPDQNYTTVFVMAEDRVSQDRTATQEGGEGIVQREMALLGLTRVAQAQRMAQQYLNLVRYCNLLCSFRTSIEAIHCEAGDVVTVSHDVPNWTSKPFRIVAMIERENDEVELFLREHNPTVYSDRYPATVTRFQYGAPFNPLAPIAEVTNLTLSEEGYVNLDGDLISVILVQWSAPQQTNLAGYVIQSSKDGEAFREEVRLDSTAVSHSIVKVVHNSTYTVKVRTVSIRDVVSTGQTASISIVGVNSPPADVIGFTITQTSTRIVFLWEPNTEADIWGYEIREGAAGWDSAQKVVGPVLTNRYDLFQFSAGIKTYMIKAIDNMGNYSVNPGTDTVTITSSPTANVAFVGDEWYYMDGHFDDSLAEWIPTTTFDPSFFRLAVLPRTDKRFDIGGDKPDNFDSMAVPMNMDTTQETSVISLLSRTFDAGGSVGGVVTAIPVYQNVNGMTVTRQIQTSSDGITFSTFSTPSATDPLVGRYFRWLLTIQAASANAPVGIAGFQFSLDVDDVVIQGDNVAVDVGGTTVQLGSTFIAIRSVVANVVGSNARFVVISEITSASFKATVYDTSGVSVADSINYICQGY